MKSISNLVLYLFLFLLLLFLTLPVNAQVQLGQSLTPSGDANEIALSGDGNRIVISDVATTTVRVFEWNSTAWVQVGNDIVSPGNQSSNDLFGRAIYLSDDGNRLLVGAQRSDPFNDGAVYVFVWTGSTWDYQPTSAYKITADTGAGQLGSSVDRADGPDVVIAGAPTHSSSSGSLIGLAKVFKFVTGLGYQEYTDNGEGLEGNTSSDSYGESVSISDDGERFAIGTNGNYAQVQSFVPDTPGSLTGSFVQIGSDLNAPTDINFFLFGSIVKLSGDGNNLVVNGAAGTSEIYVLTYEFNGTDWVEVGPRLAQDFIVSMDLSADGNTLMVGSRTTTSTISFSTYNLEVFQRVGNEWQQLGNSISTPYSVDPFPRFAMSSDGMRTAFTPNNQSTDVYEYEGPCPDLSPTTFTYNENNNTWTVEITNLGTEAIDFSGNSVVAQAYWNSTPTVAGGLPAGGFVMSGTLAPGATFMTTLSAGSNPEQKYLVLMVDLNDDLVECDETNNLASILVNPPPTCDDEIQNGDETGVDCGGPDCDPCIATCTDGLQNGNEIGVDCGGPDCDPCGPAGDITELFFSEYIEGSGSNKAFEIFNGTGQTVNLSGYRVELYNNGRELASGPNSFVNLTGSIANNDVYVIVNGAAAQALTNAADLESSGITGFNGDDALVLLKDGAIIDMFGTVGQDPGSAWTGGGVSTLDMTLVRSPSITAGVPAGFTNPSLEWLGFPQNTFDSIGFHRINMPVLPITLHTFTASLAGKSVQLSWQTAAEENTERFSLERSADGGRSFQFIGSVAARNRENGATYQYLDEQVSNLAVQRLYYRLRAQDFDGTSDVFGPVAVDLGPYVSSTLKVFPNPLSVGEAVHIQGAAAGAKVELRAMDGRLLATLQPSAGNTYALPELAAGVYMVRTVNEGGKLQTLRFVIR